jgi:hypothetical protein
MKGNAVTKATTTAQSYSDEHEALRQAREEEAVRQWAEKEEKARIIENGQELTVQQWLDIRKEAGKKIDPETAEVFWTYAQTFDPYGVSPRLPEHLQQVGREYFACSPGSEIWVVFSDLPEEVREALWDRHKRKLAFPAGL